uniref:L-Fucosyltransferase n=1 Tax=Trieres chinensis TaxID=1514140 RepID=A0A7S2EVL0_TRICV
MGLMMSIDDRPARLCYQLPQPWKKGGDQYSNHMDRITGYFEGPFTATCPPGVVLAGQKFVKVHETGPGAYTPLDLDRVGDSDGVSLMGSYLQSYKYFEQILPSVKQIFTFNEDIQAAADTHLKNLVAGASPDAEPERVVGIHIRRGDQVSTDSVRRPIFRFPPDAFFAEAMSHFERAYRENGVVFVVTSDDLDWAHASKVFHRPNVRFSLFSKSVSDMDHNAALDLALLTSCDDIIMSLGTFGAWAGLLSGGSVIYYRDQLDMTNPAVQGHYNVEDLFPSDWISIGDDDLIAEKAVQ